MTKYEEIKERIQIIDYARSIGLHPYPVGSYFSLREHDSVRIDPRKNTFFRNSTGEHGSVIDFALVFTGLSLSDVLKELESYSGDLHSDIFQERDNSIWKDGHGAAKTLQLPERDLHYRNIFAYLIKTRCIAPDIVKKMVERRMLYQDKRKNCVFVSYENGLPVFACKRGTNTARRYVADVAGSDYRKGCFFGIGSKTLLICESVIDLLSFVTMNKFAEECDQLALTGVSKTDAVYYQMAKNSYDMLIIALDNDDAGKKAAQAIQEGVKESGLLPEDAIYTVYPKNKDWNDDLVKRMKQ